MPFTKGKPRPLNAGRRRGTPNKGTVRARRLVSEVEDSKIVRRVVTAAIAGDPEATAVYFRHLRPPPPRAAPDKPFDLDPPKSAQEARDAIARITSMIARAEIDAVHGSVVVAGLEAYLGARAAELEAEVEKHRALLAETGS